MGVKKTRVHTCSIKGIFRITIFSSQGISLKKYCQDRSFESSCINCLKLMTNSWDIGIRTSAVLLSALMAIMPLWWTEHTNLYEQGRLGKMWRQGRNMPTTGKPRWRREGSAGSLAHAQIFYSDCALLGRKRWACALVRGESFHKLHVLSIWNKINIGNNYWSEMAAGCWCWPNKILGQFSH